MKSHGGRFVGTAEGPQKADSIAAVPLNGKFVPQAGVSTCKKIVGRIARSTGASATGDIPFGLRAAESSLRVRTTAAALTLILVDPPTF
jgi:hypothetical protein